MENSTLDNKVASSVPAGRRPGKGFWIVVSACVAWILIHAWVNDRILSYLSATSDPAAGTDRAPLPVILRHMAYDGYLWVRHAERLGKDGRYRLRYTDFDNAPKGREVHWNSAFAWYLRGLGALRQMWVKEPLRTSIARMGIWANPVLLAIFLPLFSQAVAKRWGDIAGMATALGMLCSNTFYEGFYPAYPDHHGIISAAIMGCIFGILWAGVGWVAGHDSDGFLPRDQAVARRGMLISALFGAIGFWVSAISMTIAMIGIGLGALVAAFMGLGSPNSQPNYRPDLWRYWGRIGALATFGFYLFEYFPSWPVLRLEVNHPLFALAWWGAGEGLAIFTEWLMRDRRRSSFPWMRLVLPSLAVVAIPIIMLIFGERVHAARGAFLAAIHTHISEFKPLLWRIYFDTMTWSASFGAFPLFVFAAVPLVFLRRVPFGARVAIVGALGPIIFITGMHFYQIRWGTLGGGVFIALGAVVLPLYWEWLSRLRWRMVARVTLSAVLLFLFLRTPYAGFKHEVKSALLPPEKRVANPLEALHLVMRDIAEVIRRQAGDRPVVLLSSPNASLLLGTMGDFQTIGTLYWENAEGLQAAARMFAAQTDDEALRLLQDRGVTHVALINWENFIEPYVRIIMPEGGDAAVLNSFGFKALFRRILPIWCRPIPYPRYPLMEKLGLEVLLLEVAPTQSLVEALYHVGVFHRIEGRWRDAEPIFREILAQQPDSNRARLELAAILLDTNRTAEGVREFIEALKPIEGPARENLLLQCARRLLLMNEAPLAVEMLQAFPPAIEADRPEGAHRMNLLAWILATTDDERVRNPERSLEILAEIERANAAGQVPWGDTQAAALAALGRFEEAIAVLERHIAGLKRDRISEKEAELLNNRMEKYRAKRPWIESFRPPETTPTRETGAARVPTP